MSEPSTKPYLLRAIHEWCMDNGFTPYLAVSVDERTVVPREYVKGGEIVLNVSTGATNRLSLGNELITFQARFGGVARELSIPVEAVSAIYARENGHGMAFEVHKAPAITDDQGVEAPAAQVPQGNADAERRPAGLSAVPKGDTDPASTQADSQASSGSDSDAPTDGGAPRGGRPRLTRVK